MYDTLIIGSGPAGMTAGIYAARRQMKTLIIGRDLGGQMMWASEFENYPGFKSIPAFDLITKMQEQVAGLGVEIKTEEVSAIKATDNDTFVIDTNQGTYETKSLILALGLAPQRLAIPGEIEFGGRGVTYCATCDGPFYKGKKVVVIGGGNAALDAAELLSKIAAQVYLVHRREEFRGFEGLVEEVKNRNNIELVLNSEVKEIIGSQKVEKIRLANVVTNEMREIEAEGVFVEIGRVAHTDLVADLVDRNEKKQIVIDEKCRTSREGIFAAGDVTDGEYKQITIACGQGTIAALAAYQYLQLKSGKSGGVLLDRGKI